MGPVSVPVPSHRFASFPFHFRRFHSLKSSLPPYQPALSRSHLDPILFPTHQPSHQLSTNHQHHPLQSAQIRFPPKPSSSSPGPPLLSASVASIHNAALVYLHRGLAIHAQPHLRPPSSLSDHSEPFLSAVVKGFAQIVRLQTGLENAQPRHVLASLVHIVRTRLASPNATPADWASALPVILHAALRPRLTVVGQWAWDELHRRNYARLTELWSHLLAHGPPTIPLDPLLFTVLVIVAAIRSDGPPLADIVNRLVPRICSAVLPDIDLTGLPAPARARYYLRAIELALLWRRSPDQAPSEDDEPSSASQDTRIVHLLRRAFHARRADSVEFCIHTTSLITEAVDGSGDQPGWLAIDWREPGGPGVPLPSMPTDRPTMALTKPVIGGLLSGFATQGMLGRVDELVALARRRGGMSRYLWIALLHGLVTGSRAEMVGTYADRMATEDGLVADVEAECLRVSAQVATDLVGADRAIARLVEADRPGLLPAGPLNTVVHALLRRGELERAEGLLKHMAPNATTLNHFLNHFATQHRPDLQAVLGHLRRFEMLGVKPDVVSFTTMLNVLLKLGVKKGTVAGMMDLMEEMGVEANGVTYGAIVHHLCRSGCEGDVELALELVDRIEERGVATTEITYTALIQAFLRVHVSTHTGPGKSTAALSRATQLVGRLRGRGQGANQVVYNALLNSLLSTGHITAGLEVFSLMLSERQKVQLDRRGMGIVDSYGIVLRRLCEAGLVGKAKEVVKLLKDEKLDRWPDWIGRIVDRIDK